MPQRPETPADLHPATPGCAQFLRQAVLSEITPPDLRAVTRRLIESAKAGDSLAGATLVNLLATAPPAAPAETQPQADAEPPAAKPSRRNTDLISPPRAHATPAFWDQPQQASA